MAIEIIDTLSQKNNGIFPLVDSNDIKGGFYQVDSIEERDLIPSVRRKEGMLCAVKNKLYQLVDGIENDNWVVFNVGTGEGISGDYADKEHTHDDLYALKETVYTVDEIDEKLLDITNEKIDDVVLEGNVLNFYANNTIIKSITIENDGGHGGSSIDDINISAENGITYIKLFSNGELIKTLEIKTGGDGLIHVGTEAPTADNCEVWIDTTDIVFEANTTIKDTILEEVQNMFLFLNNKISKLEESNILLKAEIEALKQGIIPPSSNETTVTGAILLPDGTPLLFDDGSYALYPHGSIFSEGGIKDIKVSGAFLLDNESPLLLSDNHYLLYHNGKIEE